MTEGKIANSILGICIVVGGSGWTGSFLVSQLRNLGVIVHSVDIALPRKELAPLHSDAVQFHRCDITDTEEVNKVIGLIRPTTIFHTASVVDLRLFPAPNVQTVNVVGTKNLLTAAIKFSAKYFIYTSSIDVVAPEHGMRDVDESAPLQDSSPSNDYKRTKIIAEKEVISTNTSGGSCGLRTCALRPGHIYGPCDVLLPYAGATPIALGPQCARMSFTYVENCAAAHILAAARLAVETHAASSALTPAAAQSSSWLDKLCLRSLDCGSEKLASDEIAIRSSGQMSISTLSGAAIFINDTDVNFCNMYRQLYKQPPQVFRIPTLMVRWLVILSQITETILFKLFGVRAMHPFLGLHSATLEACGYLTANPDAARQLIGYNVSKRASSGTDQKLLRQDQQQEDQHQQLVCGMERWIGHQLVTLISTDEAIRRTRHWAAHNELPCS